jgi:cytochrome P450 family 142 subfamily A polypeptide 1
VTEYTEIDVTRGSFWAGDPDAGLTWLRANRPVHHHEPSGSYVITKYEDIRRVAGDQEAFTTTKGILPGDTEGYPMMATMDDPEHMIRRRLVNKGFTPKRMRELEPRVRQVCDELIDKVIESGRGDFVWDIAAWLPLIVIGEYLGFADEDLPNLLEWSDAMLMGMGSDDPARVEKSVVGGMHFGEYMAKVVEERKAAPKDDLISVFVNADIDGQRLDDIELLAESGLLLIGGDETTRHVLTGGLYELLTHRDQWEALRADRSLLLGAVEEMLRWVSPVKVVMRTANHDIEIRGTTIPENSVVLLVYPSGNRDEDIFDDPFTFDIRRMPNEHIAFGFGTHYCLGSSLARLEISLLFDQLLDRMPDLDLVDHTRPRRREATFISGYDDPMPVTFTSGCPFSS